MRFSSKKNLKNQVTERGEIFFSGMEKLSKIGGELGANGEYIGSEIN